MFKISNNFELLVGHVNPNGLKFVPDVLPVSSNMPPCTVARLPLSYYLSEEKYRLLYRCSDTPKFCISQCQNWLLVTITSESQLETEIAGIRFVN